MCWARCFRVSYICHEHQVSVFRGGYHHRKIRLRNGLMDLYATAKRFRALKMPWLDRAHFLTLQYSSLRRCCGVFGGGLVDGEKFFFVLHFAWRTHSNATR